MSMVSRGRTSNQDYTNLLFSDSDSDSRVPDLKLPPVKGKKQKKKRGSQGYRQDETSCGIASFLKVCLLLVLFAVMAALGGVSFWSLQKINSLQEKVDRLEQSEAFTPDAMTKFQTQLVSLNKSLTDLKSGAGGLNALTTSFEALKTKMKTFEDMRVELTKAIDSSKDISGLPQQIHDLAKIVATTKGHVNTTVKNISKQEKRLTALENEFKATKQPSTDMSGGIRQDGQLVKQVEQLNQTTRESLVSVKSRLDLQEAKISTMEEFINKSAATSPVVTSLKKMAEDVMHNYISNLTASGSLPSGEADAVLKQVDELVQEMKSNVNKTILLLNGDIEEIFNNLNTLECCTKTVSNSTQGDESKVTNDDSYNKSNPASSSEAGESEGLNEGSTNGLSDYVTNGGKNPPGTTRNPGYSKDTSSSPSPNGTSGSTAVTTTKQNVTEGTDAGGESTSHTTTRSMELQIPIKIENVTNMKDLVMAFQRIHPTMAPLNDEELTTLLNGDIISDKVKKAIDTNGDSLFSIEEIKSVIELEFTTPGPFP